MNPFLALLALLIGFGFTWWYTVKPVTREQLDSSWDEEADDVRTVAPPSRRSGGVRAGAGVAAGATASRITLAERFEQARTSLTSRVEGLRSRSQTIDEDDDDFVEVDEPHDARPTSGATRERYGAASDELILSEEELAALDDEQTTAIDDEFTVGTPMAENTSALTQPRSPRSDQVRIIESETERDHARTTQADLEQSAPAAQDVRAAEFDHAAAEPLTVDADVDADFDPQDADADREPLVGEPHAGVPTQVLPVDVPTRPAQLDVEPDDPRPAGYTVKGDVKARLYLVPADADFERARPTTWFVDERAALDAGYAHYVPRNR